MVIRDIMVRECHCAAPAESVADVAQAMKRHNVGAVPVCENGRLVGIITDRDITVECVAAGMDPKQCKVREFMTANPVTASPDMDLKQVADLMGKEQVRRLPVVEGGRLVGIVSIGDLAFHLGDDTAVAELLRRISTPIRAVAAASGR